MHTMDDPEKGKAWARTGLAFGVAASIAGNVANAWLTQTSVSLFLRVPMAVVWPLGLFLAIEVMVRNRHYRGFLARVGQGGLLTVAVPTAITSYVNLHALMIKASEPGIAQLTGPLAIDGLMLGCTVMLLAARPTLSAETELTVTVEVPDAAESFEQSVAEMETLSLSEVLPVPVSPAPVSVSPAPRSLRAVSAGQEKAVQFLIDGMSTKEAAQSAEVSYPAVARYAKVYRILQDNPHAVIDAKAEKVRPELVDMLRASARELVTR